MAFGDAKKVDEAAFKRILELRELGLTQEVIAQRLGISPRTVRAYIRAAKFGTKPYQKPDAVNQTGGN